MKEKCIKHEQANKVRWQNFLWTLSELGVLMAFEQNVWATLKKIVIIALWCFQGKNLRTSICMLKLRVWSWWEAKMKLAKRANQWLRHGFKLHCLTIIRIAALRFFNIFTPVSQPQLFIMTSSLFVWIIRNFFNCNVIAISV